MSARTLSDDELIQEGDFLAREQPEEGNMSKADRSELIKLLSLIEAHRCCVLAMVDEMGPAAADANRGGTDRALIDVLENRLRQLCGDVDSQGDSNG